MESAFSRLATMTLLSVIIASMSGCNPVSKRLAGALDETDSFAASVQSETTLGALRTENDNPPSQIGGWLLASDIRWVVSRPNGGTLDLPVRLPARIWVRDTDLANRSNSLSDIFGIPSFETAHPNKDRPRGIVFRVERGLMNDAFGNHLCDFPADTPLEVAVSNRIAYANDSRRTRRPMLPGDFQPKENGFCGF